MLYSLGEIITACKKHAEGGDEININDIPYAMKSIQCEPISIDEAMEALEACVLNNDLGIDCTSLLLSVLFHENLKKVDTIIKSQTGQWRIDAIKLRRTISREGLADAKDYVDKRTKELGYKYPS